MVSVKKVLFIGELVPVENSESIKQKRTVTLDERTDFYFDKKSGNPRVIHEQENVELFDDDAEAANIPFQVGDYIIADVRHSVNVNGYQHNTLYRYAKLGNTEG